MRRLRRPALSAEAADFLAKRTAAVAKAAKAVKRAKAAEAAAAEVKRLWGQKATKAFDEIRQTLASMASGRDRCMYCEDNQGTGIDHFRPKAHYPFDAFSWPNYLLACSSCNSNDKRDQFPLDAKGKSLLIDPTAEDPLRHLALTTKTGELAPRTRKGRKSIEVFGLDRQILNDGRRAAWLTIERHVVWYAQCRRLGRDREARIVEWLLRKESFSSVLSHLVRMASTPSEAKSIRPDCRRALRQCREILTWVS